MGNIPTINGKMPTDELESLPSDSKKRDIDLLFGSGARADVLWVLLVNPVLSLTDIIRLTGRDAKDVKRAIGRLKQLELVLESEPIFGGTISQMYYGLNDEHPWLPGLMIIFENSSIGVIPLLREALMSIQGIEVAYVFGSFAIGEQNVRSDVDLVVIGRYDREALNDRMDIFEKRTDRILDPFEYTPEEWIKYLQDYPSFADTMMPKRKLFLIGDNEGLERLSKT